jgi:hypothetical protein
MDNPGSNGCRLVQLITVQDPSPCTRAPGLLHRIRCESGVVSSRLEVTDPRRFVVVATGEAGGRLIRVRNGNGYPSPERSHRTTGTGRWKRSSSGLQPRAEPDRRVSETDPLTERRCARRGVPGSAHCGQGVTAQPPSYWAAAPEVLFGLGRAQCAVDLARYRCTDVPRGREPAVAAVRPIRRSGAGRCTSKTGPNVQLVAASEGAPIAGWGDALSRVVFLHPAGALPTRAAAQRTTSRRSACPAKRCVRASFPHTQTRLGGPRRLNPHSPRRSSGRRELLPRRTASA